MLNRILSNDLPRSRLLAAVLLAAAAGPGVRAVHLSGRQGAVVAAKVLVFMVLVASFDLLLGYTGIVSFAHTMFFGIGAYGMAIATTRMGPTWEALAWARR
jgi:branched-chain amino acid transport system permease protein